MEKTLNDIALGKKNYTAFIQETKGTVRRWYDQIVQTDAGEFVSSAEQKLVCPFCGKKLNKFDWGYGCSGYRDGCKFSVNKKICGKSITENQMILLCQNGKTNIAEKKIYQDERNNVVFVGFDEQQQAKFACVRGTNTNVSYRGDCIGSDKRYAFSMEGTNKTKLFVFEAPIDLLSHATLTNQIVNHPKAWTVHSRVCLAGTSDVALEQFLKTHPEIKELHFYLDNDPAGRSEAEKHCQKYASMGYQVHNHCPKYKDLNEDLIAHVTNKPPPAVQAQKKAVRK